MQDAIEDKLLHRYPGSEMRRLRWFWAMAALAVWLGGCDGIAPANAEALSKAVPVCPIPAPATPPTHRDPLVDTLFGDRVPDPYRWLEADSHGEGPVRAWILQQVAATDGYLQRLPMRDAFARSLTALYATERFGLPRKSGSRYFYTYNSGKQQLATLMVRDGIAGQSRTLVDPSAWSRAQTLEDWAPSRRGRLLAFGQAENGSDWRSIHLVDVMTGQQLPEVIEGVNDTTIAWIGDEGFLYSRYPLTAVERARNAPLADNAVWFHRARTPQSDDVRVFGTPEHREWVHRAVVTADSRWAVIGTRSGTDTRQQIHLIDLRHRGAVWPIRELIGDFRDDWRVIDGVGNQIYFVTSKGAARNRVVRVDLSNEVQSWNEVVPERDVMLDRGHFIGNRLVLAYEGNGASFAVVTDLRGRPQRHISLNAIGAASGFAGQPGDPETFFQVSSFARPPAIYRFDLSSGVTTPFALPETPFDPEGFVVEERKFASRDGTTVPMFLVRSRASALANRPVPTLLYGYGGFDVSQTPGYSVPRMAWLLAGGAFALAEVRGGGEFGAAWHEAGRLVNKPNAFDDFIAAGEYLVREGITPVGGLAGQGASNGGLLVAAAINRRPDLFAAANPQAGVYDMLRFDRFSSGRFWTDEYGHPDREADWRVLRAYSPYHTIKPGAYPAMLVSTGDGDDRVVPAHSFKYVAALQANASDDRPHLLRVEAGAGHAGARQIDRAISSSADVLAFLSCWTGLDGAQANLASPLAAPAQPLPAQQRARIGLKTR
jgi:prolyl oligopeptidase